MAWLTPARLVTSTPKQRRPVLFQGGNDPAGEAGEVCGAERADLRIAGEAVPGGYGHHYARQRRDSPCPGT